MVVIIGPVAVAGSTPKRRRTKGSIDAMPDATVIGKVAYDAFAVISSQPNWMQSDQTFLDVLLTVSDPAYNPTKPDGALPVTPAADTIDAKQMSPLAYLPEKLFKEVVNLIVTNQNTIPVVMSDPYQLTLGPDVGHHFDYWRDTADGKPLSSAEYAAAWLTQLAEDARAGKPLPTTTTTAPPTTTTKAGATSVTTTSGAKAAAAVSSAPSTTVPVPSSTEPLSPAAVTPTVPVPTETVTAPVTTAESPATSESPATATGTASTTTSLAPTPVQP